MAAVTRPKRIGLLRHAMLHYSRGKGLSRREGSRRKMYTLRLPSIALGELDEKTKIFHRIMPAIPCPQLQVVNRSRRGNQCVTQLDAMTLGVCSQICTGSLADLNIDGDTLHRHEKDLKNPLIFEPRSMPKLCNRHGRTQRHGTSTAQSVPARENAGVASPRHFDQNVRINQNGSQDSILLSRSPRRSRRM
jgi:hypothetical protein